jgi:hypothetical protein
MKNRLRSQAKDNYITQKLDKEPYLSLGLMDKRRRLYLPSHDLLL